MGQGRGMARARWIVPWEDSHKITRDRNNQNSLVPVFGVGLGDGTGDDGAQGLGGECEALVRRGFQELS